METEWSLAPLRAFPCCKGFGMCVSLKHGLLILLNYDARQLHVHSLHDGSLVRTIGSCGIDNAKFDFIVESGLCITPDGDSVLVAEYWNNRVQEVRVVGAEDTSQCARFIGEGVLCTPCFIDCNAEVIAVSEQDRISMLSWRTGDVMVRFGSKGSNPGQLCYPQSLRLLGNGARVVVADCCNLRLCVFGLDGRFFGALGCDLPFDVVERADGEFLMTSSCTLVKLSLHGSGQRCVSVRQGSLTPLPDGGLVVRHGFLGQCVVRRGLWLRVQWVAVCALDCRMAPGT